MTTAIVVDDEVNLLDHLVRMLNEAWPQLGIVGTATSGEKALQLINKFKPDIVFLDIQMPGLSGLEVAQRIQTETHIVFVTAYDEYAVSAFEHSAVDYVLKPVSVSRIEKTVERLRAQTSKNPNESIQAIVEELMLKLSTRDETSWLQWLRTGTDTKTELIAVSDVIYFEADNKYTTLFTKNDEHLVRSSISSLSETLDPDQFWRIHRSIIVNVSEIKQAERDIRGRYTLTLKSRDTQLRSSVRYGHLFKLSR